MICAHRKLCVVPYGTLHLVRFVHPTKVGCYNICRAYGSVESSGSLPLSLTAMTGREAQPFSLRRRGVVTPLSLGAWG